jgi:hypothetical protein
MTPISAIGLNNENHCHKDSQSRMFHDVNFEIVFIAKFAAAHQDQSS